MVHWKKKLLAGAIICLSSQVMAGPFGLEQGMTLENLGVEPKPIAAGKYLLTEVPLPNPAFEQYIIQIGPQTGLCWIKAIGPVTKTNRYGYQLQTEFRKMEGVVESIYGSHQTIDRLIYGSKWDHPSEWMQGLVRDERMLASFWDRGNSSSLPENMVSIDLVATPVTVETGYIAIEYSFSNEATCDVEWLATADDVAP